MLDEWSLGAHSQTRGWRFLGSRVTSLYTRVKPTVVLVYYVSCFCELNKEKRVLRNRFLFYLSREVLDMPVHTITAPS